MNFFNFKTKSFLKMHKAKVISQSVVLVNPTYKGLFPQQIPMQPIQFENIFTPLANELLLKTVMNGVDGFRVPTQPAQGIQMAQDFVFGDFSFSFNVFPPKFTIKYNSAEKEATKIKEIAKKIVTLGNLGNSLGAVGFNYEMSIDNEENKTNLKNALSNPSIVNEFDDVNATLAYKEGEMTLNLTIADAIINGKKVIFIGANFHNDISATNRFESIMEKDFRGIVDKKLNAIFDKK
jgi:hypothetical protein